MNLTTTLRTTARTLVVAIGLFALQTVTAPATMAQTTPKGDIPTLATATVPRIDVRFTNGATLYDVQQNKSTYQDVSVTITGGGGYPDLAATAAQFRGRGNSTWTYPKKPYRIKFTKKTSPLGLTAAKSWALLANYQRNSQLSGAIMMKVAQMVDASAANHIIPVELYVDGEYQGLYNLTEQVSMSNASVVVPKEKEAALLELDTYYDEDYRFRDASFNLPVNIKDPDLADMKTDADRASYMSTLTERFNELTAKIAAKDQSFENLIDTASLARFIFVNDFIGNLEINHPKSSYLYTTKVADKGEKWKFGPVWDADWAYGYEQNQQYGTTDPGFKLFESSVQGSGTKFYSGMLAASPSTKRELLRLIKRFVEQGGMDELADYIDRYTTFTAAAMERDRKMWNHSDKDYQKVATQLKVWLSNRALYLNDVYEEAVGIESVRVSDGSQDALSGNASVYSLDGRRVGTLSDYRAGKLSRGVYIVGNKKVVR